MILAACGTEQITITLEHPATTTNDKRTSSVHRQDSGEELHLPEEECQKTPKLKAFQKQETYS